MVNFNKSQNDLKKYEETGFVFPIDVVSHQEINKIRKDFELAEYELRNDPKRLSLLRSYPAQLLPSFDTLIRNENLIAASSTVLGPNLMVWSSGAFSSKRTSGDRRSSRTWSAGISSPSPFALTLGVSNRTWNSGSNWRTSTEKTYRLSTLSACWKRSCLRTSKRTWKSRKI